VSHEVLIDNDLPPQENTEFGREEALKNQTSGVPNRRQLNELTGLRFIAALHVVLYHFALPLIPPELSGLRRVVGRGYIGVELFFVLSGFILAHNYLSPRDPGKHRLDSPRAFYWARLARVYPIYAFGLLLNAPFYAAYVFGHSSWGTGIVKLLVAGTANATLTQGLVPQLALTWNGPGWSLSVEAFFYLVFPFLGPIVVQRAKRNCFTVIGAFWVAEMLCALAYLLVLPDGSQQPLAEAMSLFWLGVLKFNPLMHLSAFVAGMATATLRIDKKDRWLAPLATLGIIGILLIPALPYPLLHNGLLIPLNCMLVLGLARGGGVVGVFLRQPMLVRLGEASYALYILQVPLGNWVELVTVRWFPGRWLAFGVYLVTAIMFTLLTLELVEKPTRRWLLSRVPWSLRRKPAKVSAPAQQQASG
jgi:peptidoglycan/LPS O-acetylase OafA/YrhL